MKTQIIKLEPHDDIVSARDKMGWGQTSRILLIWPESSRVLNRRLDLVLLQRHTASLGARLALVTHDSDVRFYARELAIPVFDNLRQAQDSNWRIKRRRRSRVRPSFQKSIDPQPDLTRLRKESHPSTPAWMTKQVTRLILFTIGVFAFLSIAAILLPTAVVTLNPKTETQEITLQVHVDPDIEDINLSGALPARPIRVIVEGRSSLPSQGTIQIPDEYATGRVTFTNLSTQTVIIPVGSVVRTLDSTPIRFITTELAEIPAGPGEITTQSVQSIKPGKNGNLPAESLLAIEGPLGLNVAVSNRLPTSGGTDRIAPAPTSDDQNNLYQQLIEDLQVTAMNELQDQLSQDDLLFASTLTLIRVLEETYDPEEVMPSDYLNLTLRLEFEVLTVTSDDIYTLVTKVLDANIVDNYVPIPETLSISFLDEPQISQHAKDRWRIHATRKLQAQLLEPQAVNLTLGLSPTLAEQRLFNSIPLNEPPKIFVTPDWWPRMPLLPFRITVVRE